jgi:DNA polymerase III delta prime subunit
MSLTLDQKQTPVPKLSFNPNIHRNIRDKLDYFIQIRKIPHILFYGPSGSGKRTLVNYFIRKIYTNDDELIKNNLMYVNCAHGKGIKFVRDDIKFFAKTNINFNKGDFFKSIVLANADKLTMDAQSALRRCIELFSHTTRFFIIVEDKYKLLKPILSRFCEFYIPEPVIYKIHSDKIHSDKIHSDKNYKTYKTYKTCKNNNIRTNLHKYILDNTFNYSKEQDKRFSKLSKILDSISDDCKKDAEGKMVEDKTDKDNTNLSFTLEETDLLNLTEKLYNKAFSALDLKNYIEKTSEDNIEKYRLLLIFHRIKREFRSEKLLMFFLLNIIFRSNDTLENISFM